MKKLCSLFLMILLLIPQGARADELPGLYFECDGKYYRCDYEMGFNPMLGTGNPPRYHAVIYSAALCAPSIPFSYEGVITVPETVYFPGADFEYDGYQAHAEPIPSLEVTGCTQNAFESCPGLIKVIFPEPRPQEGKLYGWGVSFKGCISLKTVENMDLSTILAHQFDLCSSLIDIDLSKTGNIEEFAFCGCSSLKDLKFRSPKIMKYAFGRCSGLETISFENSPVLHDEAFAESNKIKKVISKSKQPYAFEDNVFTQTVYENALLVVPEGSVETYKATNGWKNFYNIVEEGSEPPAGDAEPYVVYNDGTLTFYCDDQRSSRAGTTYDLNEGRNRPAWETVAGGITKAVFDATFAEARPTTTLYWFCQCHNLVEIEGIDNLNTSDVTSMENMFYECNSLTSLDVSKFETSNVTNMSGMFSNCSSLTSLDVSKFNTSNVINMNQMFWCCSSIACLDVSKFNTTNVEDMNLMFYNCGNLVNLIMGSCFTSNETNNGSNEFYGCSKLNKITYNGDIPANINSKFFAGVGTAEAPVTLTVPEQYKANYAAKFDGNKFYGGYFNLQSEGTSGLKDGDVFTAKTNEGVEMTFKVISAADKTCQVGYGEGSEESAIDVNYQGMISIPSKVNGYTVISIAHAFPYSRKISEVRISRSVVNVDWAFTNCLGLKSAIIPNGVTSITGTFSGCQGIEKVIIGSSVVNLYDFVFNGCKKLTDVYCLSTKVPGVKYDTFDGFNPENATLHVPVGTKDLYRSAEGWKNFKDIVEIQSKEGDVTGDGEVTKEDITEVEAEIINPSEEYDPNKDVNHDGVVNVVDIVELVNIINSGEGTGSGYFWLGNTLPTSRNFPTLNGKEVEGIVMAYTSLGEAMAKASRTYIAGEWAVVMYPSSWGTKNDLVFLDSANMKYYVVKQKVLSDFPDYLYYESTEKIGANTTITLSTESLAKAAGATLSSQLIK